MMGAALSAAGTGLALSAFKSRCGVPRPFIRSGARHSSPAGLRTAQLTIASLSPLGPFPVTQPAALGVNSIPHTPSSTPLVSFMAPEDQQHLIKALMEGYASLPPSLPGASSQFLYLQLGRSGQAGPGRAGLHISHKLPSFIWIYLILLVLFGHMELEAMLEGVLKSAHLLNLHVLTAKVNQSERHESCNDAFAAHPLASQGLPHLSAVGTIPLGRAGALEAWPGFWCAREDAKTVQPHNVSPRGVDDDGC